MKLTEDDSIFPHVDYGNHHAIEQCTLLLDSKAPEEPKPDTQIPQPQLELTLGPDHQSNPIQQERKILAHQTPANDVILENEVQMHNQPVPKVGVVHERFSCAFCPVIVIISISALFNVAT